MVALLHFCFRKTTLKSIFHSFFISKRIVGGYFQGNACTHFEKICIWTRHDHSKFTRETSIFWLHSSVFALEKQPRKLNFHSFFISKSIVGGYFQGNVCTHFQKICIWIRHDHFKFTRETSIFLVALLGFCFRKTT